MRKLTHDEMKKMCGGEISAGVAAGIWAALSFIVGIFDGYTRPYRCR